jgi:Putative auto-transporter adhesin, head GIN domain
MSDRSFVARHLALIVIVSFAAAAIFLGGAWLMMGRMGLADFAVGLTRARLPACGDLAGKTASRDLAWNAEETVSVDMPATVRYSPHNGTAVNVTGDAALLSHVRIVEHGQIELDCRARLGNERFEITLPGRPFRSFNMAGLTKLILSDIDQDELHVNIAGNSTVEATGKVDTVHINGAGLSNANLSALEAEDAHLNLAGASKVDMAAEENVELNAVGAATVRLAREPKNLVTHAVGAVQVIHGAF